MSNQGNFEHFDHEHFNMSSGETDVSRRRTAVTVKIDSHGYTLCASIWGFALANLRSAKELRHKALQSTALCCTAQHFVCDTQKWPHTRGGSIRWLIVGCLEEISR